MNRLRMSSLIALRLSGRLRVMVAMPACDFQLDQCGGHVDLRFIASIRLDVVFLDDLAPASLFGLNVGVELGRVTGADDKAFLLDLLANSALRAAFFAAALSFAMTSGGVPAGAYRPYQLSTT